MVFVIKWIFSNPYFLLKMDQEIVLFEDSEKKRNVFRAKQRRVKKPPKFPFFQSG